MCPSCCESECWDTTWSEDKDQTVSQQHHPHLPHLFLSISHDPVGKNPVGTGLHLYCRFVASKLIYSNRMQEFVVVSTVVVFQEYSTTTTCRCCWPVWIALLTLLSTVLWAKAPAADSTEPCSDLSSGYYSAAVTMAISAQATLPLSRTKSPPRKTTAIQLWCCSHTSALPATSKQT